MIKIFEKLNQWKARTTAIAALGQMDDRMLADIGIRRADIPRYVRGLK